MAAAAAVAASALVAAAAYAGVRLALRASPAPSAPRVPPARLDPSSAVVLVCDVQTRLAGTPGFARVVAASRALLHLGALLDMPAICTEQYPKGLGHTVAEVAAEEIAHVYAKKKFSCVTPEVGHELRVGYPRARHVLLVGVETHVCVLQTALDLARDGYVVHLLADGVTGGDAAGASAALNRLRDAPNVFITTFETVAFQLLGSAEHPNFRAASALVKEYRAERERLLLADAP